MELSLSTEQLIQHSLQSFGEDGVEDDCLPRALFLCHQWMIDSCQLLEYFISFYESSDGEEGRRVLMAVSYWIARFPMHFDAQRELCQMVVKLREMGEEREDDTSGLDVSSVPSYAWLRSSSVRHPVSRQVSLSFDQWSPEDLSNSLSHIDHRVLSRITINELKTYVREGKLKNTPILERSISIFNNLSNWVQCMVLSKNSPKERAEILTKFVNVGKHLRKQCNFNTMFAVIGGLSHSSISRLTRTTALLSPEIKKELAALTSLLSMQSNYAQYRKALAESKGRFRIPIMGVHLKDLIAASVGFDFPSTGRITEKKLFQLANILSCFLIFTNAPHNFPEPNHDLINTLKVSLDIRYNEDDIYNLSLKREPRTLLAFEPSSKSVVFADWASGVSSIPDPDTVNKHITAMVDAVFKHYDHDKDNHISQSEFRQIAGNFPFIDPFGDIDVDRDGQISKSEMKAYFMRRNNNATAFRREFKHDFHETTFLTPTSCGHCGKLLWGLLRQGSKCSDCAIAVHEQCKDSLVAECRKKEGGVGEWLAPRNGQYNSSFRRILNSYRSGRFRTPSTVSTSVSTSPEPEALAGAASSEKTVRFQSGRLGIPLAVTRTYSESAAPESMSDMGGLSPTDEGLASLACEEVFEDDVKEDTG